MQHTLIRNTLAFVALGLALSGCLESGTGDGTDDVPLIPSSSGGGAPLLPERGPVDEGDTQEPPFSESSQETSTEETPVQTGTSTGSTAIPDTLYNGANADDYDSFWRCYDDGVTDPAAYTSLLFTTDMRGGYFASGNSYEFTYTISDDTIQMQVPGVEASTQLLDVRFDGDFVFSTNFRVGTRDNPMSCTKSDLDGESLDPNSDGNPPDPTSTSNTTPAPSAAAAAFSNGPSGGDIRDGWACTGSKPDDLFVMILVDQGPSSIAYSETDVRLTEWSVDAAGDLLVGELRIVAPVFRDEDKFDAAEHLRGAKSLGPLVCKRRPIPSDA